MAASLVGLMVALRAANWAAQLGTGKEKTSAALRADHLVAKKAAQMADCWAEQSVVMLDMKSVASMADH